MAPAPKSDPWAHARHFPQRRHNDRSFATSTQSARVFGDAHVERRHLSPAIRPPTQPGLPPMLKRVGPLVMTARVDNTRKFPGLEEKLGSKFLRPEGKRPIGGPISETATGLGKDVGNVRRILNDDGSSVRCNRSKEMELHEATGRVKKFDMDTVLAHASRETPVSFPGWRGYPPSLDQQGNRIDYSLKSNGGAFARRQLTATNFASGQSIAQAAGSPSWRLKAQNRQFQTELRHMKSCHHDIEAQGSYRTAKTRPQHMEFGIIPSS